MATNHLNEMIETGKEILDNGETGSIDELTDRLFYEAGIDHPGEDDRDDVAWALGAYRSQNR